MVSSRLNWRHKPYFYAGCLMLGSCNFVNEAPCDYDDVFFEELRSQKKLDIGEFNPRILSDTNVEVTLTYAGIGGRPPYTSDIVIDKKECKILNFDIVELKLDG